MSIEVLPWYWHMNKVGMLHIILLILLCIYKKGLSTLAIPSIFVALYYILINHGAKQRLWSQRKWLTKFHRAFGNYFGFNTLSDIGEDDWEKFQYYRAGCRICIVMMVNVVISLFWEGKLGSAANVFPSIVYFAAADLTGSLEFLQKTVRLNAASQLISALIWGDQFTHHAIRTATMTRFICTVACFEAFEELFAHITVMMTLLTLITFGSDTEFVHLPWKIFVFIICPVELLGLRLILSKVMRTSLSMHLTETGKLAIVACSVPTSLVYLSFATKSALFSIDAFVGAANLILAIAAFLGRDTLTMIVSRDLYPKPRGKTAARIHREEGEPYLRITFILLGFFCFIHGFMIEGVAVIACGTFTQHFSGWWKRRLMLCLQTIFFVHPVVRATDTLTVMVASARIELAFIDAPYGEMAWECFLVSAIQMFLAPEAVRHAIAMISWYCSIVILTAGIMRGNAHKVVSVAQQADSFLEHAIKQKLASCGAAIGHALDAAPNSFDPMGRNALVTAFKECRKGQNSCYLSSFALQYQAGVCLAQSNKWSNELLTTLRRWISEGELPTECLIAMDNRVRNNPIELELNWDLLRAFLVDLCTSDITNESENDSLVIDIRISKDARSVVIMVDRGTEQSQHKNGRKSLITRSIRGTIADALGGRLAADNALRIRLSEGWQQQTLPPAIQYTDTVVKTITGLTGGIPSKQAHHHGFEKGHHGEEEINEVSVEADKLPRDLLIAIVDDSALVRKSLMITITKHLHASANLSFAFGADEQEALSFPSELVARNVDIAIFDENLEYGMDVIHGTELATSARAIGFKNCSILHSANTSLAKSFDPVVFDGFIEKTSSKDHFIREVTRIRKEYMTKVST